MELAEPRLLVGDDALELGDLAVGKLGRALQVRLALARKQQEQKDRFGYTIVNDDVERAAKQLADIVRSELQAAGTISRP